MLVNVVRGSGPVQSGTPRWRYIALLQCDCVIVGMFRQRPIAALTALTGDAVLATATVVFCVRGAPPPPPLCSLDAAAAAARCWWCSRTAYVVS
jgi:hypothetical protein